MSKDLVWSPGMEEAVRLYAELKAIPDCESGGPIHIITDDDNLEDYWLQPDPDRYKRREFVDGRWVVFDEVDWPPEVVEICERILTLLRGMTEERRYAVNRRHLGGEEA